MNVRSLPPMVFVVLLAAAAIAAPNTSKPTGPLCLYVTPEGAGEIVNTGIEAFLFDGYTILSDSGSIDPDAVMGIFDNTIADMVNFPASIGLTMSQALAWTEMSATPTNYSEVTMGIGATLQPGASINLGQAFVGESYTDLTFVYVDSTGPYSYEGCGSLIPPCIGLPAVSVDGPYTWNVLTDPTLTVSATVSGDPDWPWLTQWLLDGSMMLNSGPYVGPHAQVLTWSELLSRGVMPGTHQLSYMVADTCEESYTHTTLTIVPEPGTLALLGLAALALRRRR